MKKTEQAGNVYEYVSRETQKEAIDFLSKQVFTTPSWLINREIANRASVNFTTTILGVQDAALNRMLSTATLNKMLNAEAAVGDKAYTVLDLLDDLKGMLFTEIPAKKAVSIYRRNLQKSYVEKLGAIINPPQVNSGITIVFGNAVPVLDTKKSDIISYLKGHARELKVMIDAPQAANVDKATKYHLQDLSDRLKKMLDPK